MGVNLTVNWNSTSYWSTSSGGATGASIPTSSDNVIIDSSSVTFPDSNLELSPGFTANCLNFNSSNVSISVVSFSGSNYPTLNIYGSINATSTTILTNLHLVFKATSIGQTISLPYYDNLSSSISEAPIDIIFDGVGGEWTLQNNLNVWGGSSLLGSNILSMYLINGSLITNNKGIQTGNFISNYTSTRSLTLGSSVIKCANWNIDSTNLTFSSGTSTITLNYAEGNIHSTGPISFHGGSLSYYNLNLNVLVGVVFDATFKFYDNNSFNNFTIIQSGTSNRQVYEVDFEAGSTQTISGTLDANGVASAPSANFSGDPILGNAPLTVAFTDSSSFGKVIKFRSLTSNSTYTISTVTANISLVDVKDCIATGIASPFDDSNGGINRGNNIGWTFPLVSPWLWDFKDDTTATSTIENPSYVYLLPGIYTVKLTVTNDAGSDSQTEVAYINAIPHNIYLQNTFLVGAETGEIQTINAGKDDDGTPLYYELETQGIEFGNVFHRKKISDKIVVFTKDGIDSALQGKADNDNYKDINIQLDNRVNIGQDISLEGNTVTFKWYGEANETSPILEGFYLEKVTDMGLTHG